MANASELLHFFKQDIHVERYSHEVQDALAQSVQTAFNYLVDCMQRELHRVMPAFLDESMDDLQEGKGKVLENLKIDVDLKHEKSSE